MEICSVPIGVRKGSKFNLLDLVAANWIRETFLIIHPERGKETSERLKPHKARLTADPLSPAELAEKRSPKLSCSLGNNHSLNEKNVRSE